MNSRWILIFFFIGWHLQTHAMTAEVNHARLEVGDSLELILTVDPRNQGNTPDLSPLQQDFDILSTGHSQQMSIINGNQSASLSWIIHLSPKHAGKFNIPAISLGNERSQPIPIEVINIKNNTRSNTANTIFIENNVTPKSAYVQSQLSYITKLFYANNLVAGSLSSPQVDNAIVKRLGDDIHYETQRHQRHYQVIERHYAIFPQASGTLEIQAPSFTGQIAIPSHATTIWDGFAQQTRPISVKGKTTTLTIKAKPTDVKSNSWLPASQLELTAVWSPNTKNWHVGEARILELTATASGLTAAQLPGFKLDGINHVNSYPDKAELVDQVQPPNIIGIRRQRIAFVPTAPGDISIPEIRITWWNTHRNTLEQAHVAAQHFTILAAPHPATEVTTTTPVVNKEQTANSTAATTVTKVNHTTDTHAQSSSNFWIVGLCLAGWFTTIIIWQWPRIAKLLSSQTRTTNHTQSIKPKQTIVLQGIQQACEQDDPKTLQLALLAWAKETYPQQTFRTLADIYPITDDPSCIKTLQAIDKACYTGESWQGMTAWSALQPLLQAVNTPTKTAQKKLLQPLHPDCNS